MATYTITIKESTKEGKNILALLKSLSSITFETRKKRSKRATCGLDEAMRDIRLGRVNKYGSSNALFKKMGI